MYNTDNEELGKVFTELLETIKRGMIKKVETDFPISHIDAPYIHITAYILTPGNYRIDIKEIK